MARNLVIANFKGGVAKTTTAAFLAHAYEREGRRVAVVDTDPQQSLLTWIEIAEWEIPNFSMDATHELFPKKLRDVGEGYDVVIIDTPPLARDLKAPGARAIAVANQVVIPMAPSAMDVSRAAHTLSAVDALNPELDVRILLTQVIHNARSAKDVREFLTEQGHTVMRAEVPRREALAVAFGEQPRRMHNYDTVMEELGR